MIRNYDITFVSGTPMYAASFEATDFKNENGFTIFYKGTTPVASYSSALILGISSKPTVI